MKTDFKHTPGPWKIRFMGSGAIEDGFFVEAKNNNKPELGYGIEIMMEDAGDHNGYPLEQRLADAKLIAAAPELLEALQNLINKNPMHEGYHQAILKASDVIKKATGLIP
jgi:hypothetical protein